MATFRRMRLVELQEACEMRGLDHGGRNKKGLIQILNRYETERERDDDDGNEQMDMETEVEGTDSLRHVEDRPIDSESVRGRSLASGVRPGDSSDQESVSLLELKLALVREQREKIREEKEKAESAWEIERQRLELGIVQNTSSNNSSVRSDISRLLPRMAENEPIVFFSAFERTLTLNGVPRADCTKFLGGCLTFKANKALTGLSLSEHQSYDMCKKAVLDYYRLDHAQYLKLFHTARRESAETYKMLRVRLSDYLNYYVEAKGLYTFDALYFDMLTLQLLSTLAPDVRAFVMSKQPKNSEEASSYADLHTQMARTSVGATSGGGGGEPAPTKPSQIDRRPAAPMQMNKGNGLGQTAAKRLACYNFGSTDHKKASCPLGNQAIGSSRPNFNVCTRCGAYHDMYAPCHGRGPSGIYAAAPCAGERRATSGGETFQQQFVVPVRINNCDLWAVRDTGCLTHTIISPKYVAEVDYTGNYMSCRGVFDCEGICHEVPLAVVRIYAPDLGCPDEVEITVGVWPLAPGVECLLGNQMFRQNPEFTDVVERRKRQNTAGDWRSKTDATRFENLKQRSDMTLDQKRSRSQTCNGRHDTADVIDHKLRQTEGRTDSRTETDPPTGKLTHGVKCKVSNGHVKLNMTGSRPEKDMSIDRPAVEISDTPDVQVNSGDTAATAVTRSNGNTLSETDKIGASEAEVTMDAPQMQPSHDTDSEAKHQQKRVDVSAAGMTPGGGSDDEQTRGKQHAQPGSVSTVITRNQAAELDTCEMDDADVDRAGGQGTEDEITDETREGMALSDDTDEDNTVTPNEGHQQADNGQLRDVIKDFSSIDITDLEAPTETMTGIQTETTRDFKRAQDADRRLDSFRTRALAGGASTV